MKNLFKNFIIAGACLALTLSYGCKNVQTLSEPSDLIPAPVEMTVTPGCISADELANLPIKEKISEKALLRYLEGQELTEWQLKSAYWMEITPKCVKIVAADEQGAYYARQSVKMMATINETVACCNVLDWPRFQHRGFMLDESRHYQGKEFVYKCPPS